MNNRIEKLQQILIAENVDGALYAPSANLQYLLDSNYFWQRTPETGGFWDKYEHSPHFLNNPDTILYVPAVGVPTLFLTHERAKTVNNLDVDKVELYYINFDFEMKRYIKGKKIAVGQSCELAIKKILASVDNTIETIEGEVFVEKLRVVKDAKEIEIMRNLAAFTDKAMEHTVKLLKPGVTQNEISRAMVQYGRDNGAQDIPFTASCSMVHTDSPEAMHIMGHDKNEPMVEGTSIGFDFGYIMNGYCSDYGRSFYCGTADPFISGAYKALQEAQLHLLSKIKPGVGLNICFNTLHKFLEPSGYAQHLRKFKDFGLMGHQIGIDVHKRPWLHTDQTAVFEPGMIMCIEPKIYIPGKAFMRVEDMVLITENGCESLTKFDRNLYNLPV